MERVGNSILASKNLLNLFSKALVCLTHNMIHKFYNPCLISVTKCWSRSTKGSKEIILILPKDLRMSLMMFAHLEWILWIGQSSTLYNHKNWENCLMILPIASKLLIVGSYKGTKMKRKKGNPLRKNAGNLRNNWPKFKIRSKILVMLSVLS